MIHLIHMRWKKIHTTTRSANFLFLGLVSCQEQNMKSIAYGKQTGSQIVLVAQYACVKMGRLIWNRV